MKKYLTKTEWKILIIGIIVGIASRGIAIFSLGYSIDDYLFARSIPDWSFNLTQGRWAGIILNNFLLQIGAESFFASTILILLSQISLSFAGLVIVKLWKVSNNLRLASLITAFFVSFPYHAEIYTFRMASASFTVAIFLCFLALIINKNSYLKTIASVFIFIIGIGIYQVIINYALVFISSSFLVKYITIKNKNALQKIRMILSHSDFKNNIKIFILGTSLYLLLNKIILSIFKVQGAQTYQILNYKDLSKIIFRLKEVGLTYIRTFFTAEPIFPLSVKMILITFLLVLIIIMFFKIKKHNQPMQFLINFLTFLFLLIISSISFLVPLSMVTSWWPVPRVIGSISIFWLAILTCLYQLSKNNLLTIFTSVLSSVAIFSFIGINNHVYIDQLRINKMDQQKASRIITRLEIDKNFNNIITLAIVGNPWTYPLGIKTVNGDMNISAFGANWSKVPLINESTGYNFLSPTQDQLSLAKEYCRQVEPWPDLNSTTIIDSLGIVCLE